MNKQDISVYKRKRNYLEIAKYYDIENNNYQFKPKFKENEDTTSINYKISLIKIKTELDKFNEFIGINIVSNILTKFNPIYNKYIQYAPKKEKTNSVSGENQNKKLSPKKLNKIERKVDSDDDDNSEENLKNDKNPDGSYILKKKYINEELYPIVRNYRNIDSSDILIKKISGDGNCLFRAISYFLHNTENKYYEIRNQIYNEAIKRKSLIPNVEIDTEMGKMRIHDYISTINNDKNWGGDLEISISYDLYKYNIAEYKEIYNVNDELTNLEFIQYINSDNNEQKDLIILTNINNNHFNLAYYKNKKDSNKNIVNNTKEELNNKYSYENDKTIEEDTIKKYTYKNLLNLDLNEILNYYDDESINSKDNLSDIYLYKYYYKKSGNKEGKFSDNFKKKYEKNLNYKNIKNLFKKRIKNYYISENKELVKLVDVKDPESNGSTIKSLLVVPIKDRENLLKYYHYITGHKNYHILHDKIINEGFYWNNINESCKDYIKNCNICISKNKNIFLPPPCNQILCKKPKELYVIDITDLPHEYSNNKKEKTYLLSIIDHFSKFAENFIINNKDKKTVLNKIKIFIKKYGPPEKILTDNGGEFINKLFKTYCNKNDIILIHGRPRHPQTQGAVERYNRTIKELIKNIYCINKIISPFLLSYKNLPVFFYIL